MVDFNLVSILFPLAAMVFTSLFVAILTNKSPAVICATCGMVLAILIWQGIATSAFYVVVALFIGISLWLSVGSSSGSDTQ